MTSRSASSGIVACDQLLRELVEDDDRADRDDLDRPTNARAKPAPSRGRPRPAAPAARRARHVHASSSTPAVAPAARRRTARTARPRADRATAPARCASTARTSALRRATTVTSPPARPSGSRLTCETMNSIGRSSRSRSSAAAAASARQRDVARPSEVPIVLSWRAVSERALTVSRISSSAPSAARAASIDGGARRRAGTSAMWTEGSRAAPAGQVTPQLVGRDRQDRREQPRQAVRDDVHRRLRRAPLARVGAERVQAVLRDVGVERAQVHRHELVSRLEDRREVVVLVARSTASRLARSAPARSDRPPAARSSGTASVAGSKS